ncbi:hypothetical protein JVT61DRAFT_5815 [Boletus reticuloceps]|uniref:Uncharacterized protein n=1 Tax=Boletus reticuloceps TaxID=495285 RepID=A0A8I2YZR2_9AGAM|nr:hypothetical protein JVT61DRAFT_5815 [Boletus reticuloceps]
MANFDKPEPVSPQDGPEAVTLSVSGEPLHSRAQSPVLDPERPYSNSATPDHAPPPPSAPAASAACSPFAIPHPKRFNAVNINKKFLQKNSTSSATASAIASLAAAKTGSPAPRPTPHPPTSHSKLVTAKLTSTAQLSTATSSGWSRPSSATPPVSATPSSSSNAPPPQPPAPTPAVPQFPHVGKVIQPQPRNALASSSPLVKKDTCTKSAWGNAKSLPITSESTARSDFPTAAEVAQGRIVKVEEPKPEDPPASRRVPPQEADAFRGVHLDPNAHHWDEMEEDDDNFLDNVIEFGDGRQYKVAPATTIQPPVASTTTMSVGGEITVSTADHVSTEPVSKEERFADDFDRSWPRARQSPIMLQRDLPNRSSQPMSISPTPSQLGHSSVEGSRVLFNEHSNSFGLSRRSTHGESAVSPVESRFSRDAPPHSPSSRSWDFIGRRNAERDSGSHTLGVDNGQNKVRSRDPAGTSGSFHDSRSISEKRHRRLSGASFASSIPDRQQGSSPSLDVPFSRRSHARESPSQHLSILPANVSAHVSRVSHLPGTSHGVTAEAQLSGASPVLDIEGVHKTAMHISAERAKQRRQLEEEEREKEKERARKKAAELEARMIQTQKAAAEELIQQAITPAQSSNQLVTDSEDHKSSEVTQYHANERQPSLKPVVRPQRDTGVSRSTTTINGSLAPSDQVDSWRSQTRLPPQPLPALSPPVFQEPSDVVADDNLEVVDFSDLGKFIGGEQASLASLTPAPSSYSPTSPDRHPFPPRPVASDFFEDAPMHVVAKTITSPPSERHTLPIVPEASVLPSSEQIQVPSSIQTAPTQGVREQDSHRLSGPNGAHTSARTHPSPAAPHHRSSKGPAPYRQVTMSALDDVMSRIKGALDDMQVGAGKATSSNEHLDWRAGVSKPKVRVVEPPVSTRMSSKDTKWLPPALRQPQRDLEQEVFGTTYCDPPCSPRPDTLVVKLPVTLRPVDAIPKRQLHLLKSSSSYVRFDTLSWDPPVDGMSKRDLSVNEILFKRPPPGKGNRLRYKVQLPRTIRTYSASLPKVNLPSGFSKNNIAPGRLKAVDDLPTWRRGPVSSSTTQKTVLSEEKSPILDVTGCSPALELTALLSERTVTQEVTTKSEFYLVRQRTQPKLPEGSAVGFYRDPGSSSQDSKNTVNFTVTSELEGATRVSQPESKGSDAIASPVVDEVNHDMHLPSLSLITQAESKVSEEATERSLRTPASASFSTTWTKSPLSFSSKDSPARAPDPEHLKAVWSQTADKEQVSAVNSLEGIADDLTALPFTIQEVKSEDGETPPPTSATVASKISIHDVTRAFQQVPTPSNVPHRPPPVSPSAVNGPVTRPPTFSYPTPLQAPSTAMRPHFAAFSSPMLAHSPSPTVLYPPTAPSPIPRVPMNGHPQLYNQPMWVPMQASQNNNAVRPIPSPYPTQMVAYPAPSPVHPVYNPGLSPQNVPPSVTGSAPPRPRGMSMLSPVMHPAVPANVPMYNGSPVLMHPPAMIPSGHRPPYMNSGHPERGQGRSEGMSGAPHMQQPSHSQNHIPPQPMYTHVPFSRPSW